MDLIEINSTVAGFEVRNLKLSGGHIEGELLLPFYRNECFCWYVIEIYRGSYWNREGIFYKLEFGKWINIGEYDLLF